MRRRVVLRLHPRIASLAERNGTERLYLAFAVAKSLHINRRLPGVAPSRSIPSKTLVRTLGEHLHRDRSTIQRWLTAGDGVFWDIERDVEGGARVFLPNVDRLAQRLRKAQGDHVATRCAGHYHVSIPLSELGAKASIKAWRKVLFAVQLPSEATVIARGSIAARTGVSVATQRRWEREGDVPYHDGQGGSPVRSAPTFTNRTALIPTDPVYGRLSVHGVVTQLESRNGRSFSREGYFAMHTRDERAMGQPCRAHSGGCRVMLCRQLPKQFQSNFRKVKRHLRSGQRTNASHDACYGPRKGGNAGNLPLAISYADVEPKRRRPTVWEAPTHRRNMRQAIPVNPNASLLTLKHGRGW